MCYQEYLSPRACRYADSLRYGKTCSTVGLGIRTRAAITAWKPAGVSERRGQVKYSDLTIETALTLRLVFNLPLRQTKVFLRSLSVQMGIDLSAPNHTTLSRLGQRRMAEDLRRSARAV